jgi:hypothetical protein
MRAIVQGPAQDTAADRGPPDRRGHDGGPARDRRRGSPARIQVPDRPGDGRRQGIGPGPAAVTPRARRGAPARPVRRRPPPGPDGATAAAVATAPRPALAGSARVAHPARGGHRAAPRPPFVFLVLGLLSGGLICLLLLNTVLAAGTFQMTSLQQANANLALQQQELEQQIALAESPAALAQRARQLGMLPVRQPLFVNPASGRIYGRPAGTAAGTRR